MRSRCRSARTYLHRLFRPGITGTVRSVPGRVRPKVEALVNFVRQCPNAAGIITSSERLGDARQGKAGTRIEASPLTIDQFS